MTRSDDPRAELLEISARMRHLQAEHVRSGDGSAVRRKLEAEMSELSDHLERRLATLVDDEPDREGWRAHAHHSAPHPRCPWRATRRPRRGRRRRRARAAAALAPLGHRARPAGRRATIE